MVSQAIHDLGFARQSAEGAAAAAAAFRVRLSGGTVGPMRTINDLAETSRDRLRARAYTSIVGVDGNPSMFARPPSLGLLLYLAMGARAVQGAGDPYTHTFTLANLLPYSTWWRMLGDLIYERHVDCKIGQLVLRSEAGGPLTAEITLVGKKPQKISSALFTTEAEGAAIDDGRPFYHYDGESGFLVPARAAALSVTGASATDILTSAAHGLAVGDVVVFTALTGGAGLVVGQPYYVIATNLAANTFMVSATPGGAAVNFTSDITAGSVAEMTVLSTARRVALTINNNAARWQGDALMAEDVTEGMLDVSLETEQRVDEVTRDLWLRYHYGTEAPADNATPTPEVIELAAGGLNLKWTAVGPTPGPERSLQALAPRLQIASIAGFEPGTGNDPLVGTVTYRVYSPTSGSGLTAILKNGQSAY